MNRPLRKTLTQMLLINWSRFGLAEPKIENSTLITGNNGTGKTTALDAITYIISGNTKFNPAANDSDRTVLSYVRGDTKDEGNAKYLRFGNVISYIVMESDSPTDGFSVVTGVCIESADEGSCVSSWFIKKDAHISDINFYERRGEQLFVTPKNDLTCKGVRFQGADFLPREKGILLVQRTLGIRCETPDVYRRKLVNMMSFQPDKKLNVDKFIRESVLPEVEINAIASLREAKTEYERLQIVYDGILVRQQLLDAVESYTRTYEQRLDFYNLKQAELYWQNYILSRNENFNNKKNIEYGRSAVARLNEEYETARNEATQAQFRYHEADKTLLGSDFRASEKILEAQIKELSDKIRPAESELGNIVRLKSELERISDALSLSDEEKGLISSLDDKNHTPEGQRAFVRNIKEKLNAKIAESDEGRYLIRQTSRTVSDSLEQIGKEISELENARRTFPEYVRETKEFINAELKKQGIQTEVRTFAELIEDITEPEWRDAIESFLWNRRFNLMIDARYCKAATRIYHSIKNRKKPDLVFTDKLGNFDSEENSAAGLLKIANVYARRYADYVLGRIYLCNDLEELHEHPLGGLMKDGTLAQGYTMKSLNMSDVKYYIGHEGIRLQLKKDLTDKARLDAQLDDLSEQEQNISKQINLLKSVFVNPNVRFEVLRELPALKERMDSYQEQLEQLKQNPSYALLLDRLESAKKEQDDAIQKMQELYAEKTNGQRDLRKLEAWADELEQREQTSKSSFESFVKEHPDLRQRAKDEYVRQSKNSSSGEAISERTLVDNKRELDKAAYDMMSAQVKYANKAGWDENSTGIAFIGDYRKEHDRLMNIEGEEAKQNLDDQRKKMERTFVHDFMLAISEALEKADEEIDAVNDELSDLRFGNDVYKFITKPRGDKERFFRIKKKIYDDKINNPGLNIDIPEDDDELNQDIHDMIDELLIGNSEAEYGDYRTYYSYNMSIMNVLENTKTTFAAKHGSASNGEKQTPYYIILAASLMQCYPKGTACTRLALIDEAFASLSPDRIEQMVRFFELNGLQVIYAAPPEKINTIGRHINTTISLAKKGRLTYSYEGKIDEYIDEEPEETA